MAGFSVLTLLAIVLWPLDGAFLVYFQAYTSSNQATLSNHHTLSISHPPSLSTLPSTYS